MQGGWQPPPGGGSGYGGGPPSAGFGQNPYGGVPSQGVMPGPMPGPMPGAMPGSFGAYEFNDTENQVIDKAAGRAKLWGIISTTIGALQVLGSCGTFAQPSLGAWLPSGIVAIIVGVTFIGVGNSLKNVVQTRGNDVAHMMQALQKMSSAFTVQIVCAIVGFVLAVFAFILFAFILVAAAAAGTS